MRSISATPHLNTPHTGQARQGGDARGPQSANRHNSSAAFNLEAGARTNDVEGRKLLAEAALPNVHAAATMNEAAEKVVALAAGAQS